MLAIKCVERSLADFIQLSIILLFASFLLGCRASAPENASAAISLMTKFSQEGHYDRAIALGQDWLKKHPEETSHLAAVYDQIAITYLMKASKDNIHKEEWIQRAVGYYDKALSVHRQNDVDIESYTVGRGLEFAGDLSKDNSCLYYERSVKDFEDESPFIQGESYTAYGHTIPLAPIRHENEKALQRLKEKLAKAGCTQKHP